MLYALDHASVVVENRLEKPPFVSTEKTFHHRAVDDFRQSGGTAKMDECESWLKSLDTNGASL